MDATIILNTYCTVPVSTLRVAPFAIDIGSNIYTKVIAFNALGDSPSSSISTGLSMPNDANTPDAPTNLTRNSAFTTKNQVSFTWSAPVNNGGAVITSYLVMWDSGSGTYFT